MNLKDLMMTGEMSARFVTGRMLWVTHNPPRRLWCTSCTSIRYVVALASHNDVASSQARTCDRLWPTPHVEDTTNRGCSQDRKDGREYHTAQSAVDYMITNVSISIVQYTEAFAD
jgi:hypothetical protein